MSENPLRFRIAGLDCQNEVAVLTRELQLLVGGPQNLSFDTAGGLMVVTGNASVTPEDVQVAVARTGMRAILEEAAPETRWFEVSGLYCQNEVRQLKQALDGMVSEAQLGFDTKQGLMSVAADASVKDSVILNAVARTGMSAIRRPTQASAGSGATEAAPPSPEPAGADIVRSFHIQGLDCQNEVRLLREAVGPLVGGADRLSFDTKAGTMNVAGDVRIPGTDIAAAIASTGMSLVGAAVARGEAPAIPACTEDLCGAGAPIAPLPAQDAQHVIFRVHGMDCAEEIAALKREVGPVVGGEGKLAFDLINGRMSLAGDLTVVPVDAIIAAVARAGMSAELWQAGATAAGVAEQKRRKLQSTLTAASGLLTALGFGMHVAQSGSVAAAFGADASGAAALTPAASLIAYSLAILCAVRYVAPKAWLAARRLRPDMNLLMVIAVAGAIAIGEWFEAAIVSFFFALALALESWSLDRARRAVAALMELAPPTARVKMPDGREIDRPATEIVVGTHIIVRPGDKIALDGRVVAGASTVNQAPITGESMPVTVEPGADVFAGTINGEGALEIETVKSAQDTTLAQIIRMVGSAQSRRAPTEQWVERFARIYTPAVLGLALLVLAIPPILDGAWDLWFYRALVLLVIACPCALVISTPVSIVAGLAGAAKAGILVKGGAHLESPAGLHAIAMDKTGTLTEGRPRVVRVVPNAGTTELELLTVAAALEARSEHPLARAIVEHASAAGIRPSAATGVQAVPGKGVIGQLTGRTVWLGSRRYLDERGVADASIAEQADALAGAGRTLVAVGDERRILGLIALADTLRPQAAAIVSQLHAAGIAKVVMLTGDNRATAEAIAAQTGIDEVRAELLPGDKVEAVEDLVRQYGQVAMIGDGVNDAPAMARASVGIAMGAIGSDAAIETADIALMTDDLSRVPWLVLHSRAALAIIRQNIGFSIGVKAVFTVLTFAGAASLWGAIVADVGASLLVVLNGLRLLNRKGS
ncbi:MAG: heavy metal translocating P-type ATPase [Rhodospirillaceae bacterium]|nr:heavy metal translocating P-type ATPase [Rhodospirillaceae bacterium]